MYTRTLTTSSTYLRNTPESINYLINTFTKPYTVSVLYCTPFKSINHIKKRLIIDLIIDSNLTKILLMYCNIVINLNEVITTIKPH